MPKPKTPKRLKTIDLTPTWTEVLETLLVLLDRGHAEGRATARGELLKMATLADEYVKLTKNKKRK